MEDILQIAASIGGAEHPRLRFAGAQGAGGPSAGGCTWQDQSQGPLQGLLYSNKSASFQITQRMQKSYVCCVYHKFSFSSSEVSCPLGLFLSKTNSTNQTLEHVVSQ